MDSVNFLMRRSLNPYAVLVIAILLPGVGYLLCGLPRRALIMQLFMVLGAIITWHLSTPAINFVGRLSGGLFVYALSVPDAYRYARMRTVGESVGAMDSTRSGLPSSTEPFK